MRLVGADLRGAWLDGAKLGSAELYGANLQGAKFLDRADLVGAWADEATRWPEDWTFETAKARGVRYAPRPRSR
jgi:uncharacterized protein YjbI with pentapeptide repeats